MNREELLQLIEQAAEDGRKQLNLSQKGLTELPKEIGKLKNLTTLDLSGNQISEIPNRIAELKKLTRLDLSWNHISEIPYAIAELIELTELDLSFNQIGEVPNAITDLIKLTQLNLSRNQIGEVPNAITKLTNLERLDLSNNQISEIPDEIEDLTNLKSLSLSNNQIHSIPNAIGQLTNLKTLAIFDNPISVIPEVITQLSNLKGLYLGGNQISIIPDTIYQLTNLTQLYIFSTQISIIPESVTQLINLTQLNLSNNQICIIPHTISQLTNLKTLSFGSNQISVIPESITQLTKLTRLFLDNNKIDKIPEEIDRLIILENLSLNSNKINKIPESIENLSKLKTLDLRDNPLPIPPEILGEGDINDFFAEPGSVEDILNYLRQLRSAKVRPLNEAKLILIGQGSVGKTSLKKQLIYNRFDPHESQTDGLEVERWPIKVNNKDVRLNVWDFGGQEIYHATHQFFLTKRSLYLLVCNCRTSEEENRLEYWLKLIDSYGGQSPVIIIGNKKDEQPLDINRKALREKYPNIKAILETSCENGEGITELRSAIIKEIGKLKEIYDLLPLAWFEVKEQLEAMTEDFISENQYIGVCLKKNILEDENQEQLIELLHRLGVVLSFRDHPLLKSANTNVLNPDWVTKGIYTILSDEILKTQNRGIFRTSDLTRILDSNRYPRNRHSYLIDLMQQFQLCFALNDCSPSQYLIPGLLPKEEPEDIDLGKNALEFQYHYYILPESILSRFIVITHEKIHKKTYWRSGVMLAYKENKVICNLACIKADFEDKKIFITIDGNDNTRRLFLGIIRDTFKGINKSNPDITEWVPVPGHPDHQPLDYQELLGHEAMGERLYTIGKLRIKIDIRKLLDGYEPIESRQLREHRDYIVNQTNYYQYGTGDNVGNDKVAIDKIQSEKTNFEKEHRLDLSKQPISLVAEAVMKDTSNRDKIFVSYSHQDKKWLEQFKKQIKPHVRVDGFEVWDDTRIKTGSEWREEIEKALASAKVAVLLVSPNFIASDFIHNNELPPLLNAVKQEGLTIFWIPISSSAYNKTELARYQSVHPPAQPLDSLALPRRNKAWVNICEQIAKSMK